MGEDEARITQKEALGKAKDAAARRDGRSFLQYLYESRFLDGAKRRLIANYGNTLDKERIDDVLTGGVDKFYEAASTGKKILSPAPYLWKIIDNLAKDTCEYLKTHTSGDNVTIEGLPDTMDEATELAPESEEDTLSEGIKIARSLLPKIGSENIQAVMGYIIDGIEKGVEDISTREIAEALGLSEASVRKWKERGFERLKRAAIEAGYRGDALQSVEGTANKKI